MTYRVMVSGQTGNKIIGYVSNFQALNDIHAAFRSFDYWMHLNYVSEAKDLRLKVLRGNEVVMDVNNGRVLKHPDNMDTLACERLWETTPQSERVNWDEDI